MGLKTICVCDGCGRYLPQPRKVKMTIETDGVVQHKTHELCDSCVEHLHNLTNPNIWPRSKLPWTPQEEIKSVAPAALTPIVPVSPQGMIPGGLLNLKGLKPNG